MKPSGLQDKVGGRVVHLCVHAAHDSGYHQGLFGVGDDHHAFVQGSFGFVERRNGFAGFGVSDDDFVSGNLARIEGVQRLTGFHENEIRRVDHVVDGPQSNRLQPLLEPIGAGADRHVSNYPGAVEFAVLRSDGDLVQWILGGRFGHGGRIALDRGQFQFPLETSGQFAGNSHVAQAIPSVGGELEVESNVGVTEQVVDGRTDCRAVL